MDHRPLRRRSLPGVLTLLLTSRAWSLEPGGLEQGGSDRAADRLDLGALMAGLAAVPERRATFQETRRFAALDQPLISTGHLLYRRPGYLAKTTDWPQSESLVVDGGRLAVPELRTLVDAIRGPLAGDLPALRRAFAVTATGGADGWTLGLVPLDPRAARLLRQAQVSGRGPDVTAVRLAQANGDEQEMAIRPLP